MLVTGMGELSPANEMSLEVLLESTVRGSSVVVFELLEVLLGELVCVVIGDSTTPDAVENIFIRRWIISGIGRSGGDSSG
jgi:hypothetical protein